MQSETVAPSAGLRAQVLTRDVWALCHTSGKRVGNCLEFSHFVINSFGFGSPRKHLLTVRVMTSMAILPLLFGCVGIFSLFKLLQCVWRKASLQDTVVVVTGATSGLGRGGSWR